VVSDVPGEILVTEKQWAQFLTRFSFKEQWAQFSNKTTQK
jgi:hypothetical protein